MSPAIQALYEQASELEPNERAGLAGILLENLKLPQASRAEIEDAWAEEIEKRMAAYHAGQVKTVAWQDLRAHLHRPDLPKITPTQETHSLKKTRIR